MKYWNEISQKWARCMGHKGLNIKSTFSEYGHVAYQIKGNEAYNKA